MKRILLAAIGLSMALSLSACDERDVAIGAAAVGAGFLAGAAYDHHRGWDYRYNRRGYYDNRYYWDRYDGRWVRNNGRWYRYRRYNNVVAPSLTEPGSAERAVAAKYRLNSRGASEVVKTIQWIRAHGKFDAFREIGMTDRDVRRLSRGSEPGSESISRMADHLNARSSAVKAMIQDLRDEFSLQRQHGYRLR